MADFLWINIDSDQKSPFEPGSARDREIRRFVQRRASSSHGSRVDSIPEPTHLLEESKSAPFQPLHKASMPDTPNLVPTKTQRRLQRGKAPLILPQLSMQARWRVGSGSKSKREGAKVGQSRRLHDDGSVYGTVEHLETVTPVSIVTCNDGLYSSVQANPKSFQEMIPTKIDTYLGAGRVDPFRSIHATALPLYGHEVLDHAITTFWPSFIPRKEDPQLHPIKSIWLDVCRNCPMVFFSFLFGAAENLLSHQGGLDSSPKNHYWRAKFHGVAIKLINEQISNLDADTEPTDELLASILTLAVYGAQPNSALAKSASPLGAAQTLEVVAHREYVKAHKDALYYLVNRKGGLSGVTMYGISVLIQATDILWSTLEQRPPALAWYQETPTLLPFDPYQPGLRKLTFYVATGFFQLPNFEWPIEFINIIDDIRKLLITLYEAQESCTMTLRLEEFVGFRNWIQHRLISLPPATTTIDLSLFSGNTTASQSPSKRISNLEITRISLLILSTFVIFPVPTTSRASRLLNCQLLALLDCGFQHAHWYISEPHLTLLMWSAMLGAVNASDVSERTRFTTLLRSAAKRLRINKRGWDEAHEVLTRFLWWDNALEELAKSVWEDVSLP